MKIYISGKDLTEKVGSLSFTTDDEANGETMTFDSLTRLLPGDHVVVKDDSVVRYKGIITDTSESKLPPYQNTAMDYSRNMNGDTVIQFKKIRADEALKKLFQKYGIESEICSIPTKITKIYKCTILEVVKSILSQSYNDQGKAYFFEVRGSKIVVAEKKKMKISPTFLMSEDSERTRSIAELRNRIVVTGNDEGSTKILYQSDAGSSQKKYGIMQHNEEIDSDKVAVAKNKAENLMKSLNKVTNTASVTMIVTKGYWDIRKNRLIYLDGNTLKGWYRIRSCTHSIENGTHYCDIELEW